MDDELPLTALAKPKKQSLDDDLPLAKLATPGAAKKDRPSTNKPLIPGQAPAAGKGKGKGRPKKEESSSSSDSDSDSYSSYSSDEAKTKKLATKKARTRLLAAKQKKERNDDGDENNKVEKKTRSPKEQVVVDLLCRWWYAMPAWPPDDKAYYEAELNKRSLRQVSIQEWEWVPEVDEKGRAKVYELSQFKGMFRKADGAMVDIRPMDSCPSQSNLMKKDLPELYSLLVKAYEEQIKDLANSKYDEKEMNDKLTLALNKIRQKARAAHEMTFATGTAAKKPRTG